VRRDDIYLISLVVFAAFNYFNEHGGFLNFLWVFSTIFSIYVIVFSSIIIRDTRKIGKHDDNK
jgi:uncharacterized membrane protein